MGLNQGEFKMHQNRSADEINYLILCCITSKSSIVPVPKLPLWSQHRGELEALVLKTLHNPRSHEGNQHARKGKADGRMKQKVYNNWNPTMCFGRNKKQTFYVTGETTADEILLSEVFLSLQTRGLGVSAWLGQQSLGDSCNWAWSSGSCSWAGLSRTAALLCCLPRLPPAKPPWSSETSLDGKHRARGKLWKAFPP